MLSDANLDWLKPNDLSLDLTSRGMGVRSKRFAMLLDDLVVKYLGVEDSGEIGVSSADAVLAKL